MLLERMDKRMIDDEILTQKDIQEILKIGRDKVYKLLKHGDIPSIQIGKSYRVSRKAFEEWLEYSTKHKVQIPM